MDLERLLAEADADPDLHIAVGHRLAVEARKALNERGLARRLCNSEMNVDVPTAWCYCYPIYEGPLDLKKFERCKHVLQTDMAREEDKRFWGYAQETATKLAPRNSRVGVIEIFNLLLEGLHGAPGSFLINRHELADLVKASVTKDLVPNEDREQLRRGLIGTYRDVGIWTSAVDLEEMIPSGTIALFRKDPGRLFTMGPVLFSDLEFTPPSEDACGWKFVEAIEIGIRANGCVLGVRE